MTRAWTRSCAACSVRKGLIFLMLCSANLQDRAVFAMCSLKVSWSSKITPRFLTEVEGVIVDEPNWIVKSCCRVGVAGKTRSSVFARLSCRWCSFIHAEMSARQPEIRAATVEDRAWSLKYPLLQCIVQFCQMCKWWARAHNLLEWSVSLSEWKRRAGPLAGAVEGVLAPLRSTWALWHSC